MEFLLRHRLSLGLAAACLGCAAVAPATAGDFRLGSGVYDITGPAAESGMFGYAASQEIDGLHQRLRARAYIIESAPGQRIVFVSADLGAMFQSVKIEVVKRLQARYGSLYSHDNVMLTATHTHVGNGGHSHYALYAIAAADKAGSMHSAQSFAAVVDGIVAAIDRAHSTMAPGSIEWMQGELDNATRNRSRAAYEANPDARQYAHDVNTRMTMLSLRRDDGSAAGVINWFAIHPTSFSLKFTKISGDNKGYASAAVERLAHTDYGAARTFVAAFANADEGDVVPVDGNAFSAPGFEGSADEYANAAAAGQRQVDKAVELYQRGGVPLFGGVDVRHQWVRMPGYVVQPAYTGGAGSQTLCRAARGASFAAGGENGPSNVSGLREGMTVDNTNIQSAFAGFIASPLGSLVQLTAMGISLPFADPCQYPKPVLLGTGLLDFVPDVLPYQLMRIGPLAVVGMPFEVTTMAGRRLREVLRAELAPLGVREVVISSLANSYSGYLTTREEYQTQNYEGASTEFGPWSLAASQQVLTGLARAMVQGQPAPASATPRDRAGEPHPERPGVVFDDAPIGQGFGSVLADARATYARGETALVRFRGAHPKNSLRTQSTFLKVERWNGAAWQVIANDWDWETTYAWRREGIAWSQVDITWRIPRDAQPGTYRIRHFGDWKNGWTGQVSAYAGSSRAFQVQ